MTFMGMSKRKSLFFKAISILIIQSFVLSSVAFAIPQDNTANLSGAQNTITNPDQVVIPREYGLVKSKYNGSAGKLIIHIQDAHCNYEAQSNIVKILENLIKNYKLNFVSVEGADGIIDTSWFKAFPDDAVRKEVADYFMKKGEITGPEFLSITTDFPIKLFGAETRSYYIQNLNAFTSSYPLKEETEKYFNQIKSVLNKLKTYIYNEDLKALDARAQEYESKKIQFNDYVRFLQQESEKWKINLREYDNFFKLVNVLVYEKKIDFGVTDKERTALIDLLSKRLAKDELTELVSQSISFKVGKISSADYYAYLKALAMKNGVDLAKDHPNLYNYIIYNSVYSKIENEKLFADIKKLETDLKEKLFANDDQRTLERLSRHIDIMIGLVNIKLLNADFDYYKTRKEEFAKETFLDFITKKAVQYGFAYEIAPPSDAVTDSIAKLEDFYAIAIKRDKALVDNTLNQMNKDEQKIAVLVTGGFHSEGIAKLLEKDGISYMVICPAITKDVPSPYIKILTNQRTPLEDILVGTAEAKEGNKEGMLAPVFKTELVSMSDKDLAEFVKNITGGKELEIFVKAMENDWVEVYVNGVPAFKVQGYLKHARNGVGGVSSSANYIVDGFIKQLVERSMHLGVPQAETDRVIASIRSKLPVQLSVQMEEAAAKVMARKGAPQQELTPGTGAVGPFTGLTYEQARALDELIKQSFTEGTVREAIVVRLDDGRDFTFQVHKGLKDRIEAHNAQVLKSGVGVIIPTLLHVHPGRGGDEKGHKLFQGHLDESDYESLSVGERAIVAEHESWHLDIFNVENTPESERDTDSVAYERWEKWLEAGKVVGEYQEVFVDRQPDSDTTLIRERLALVDEKRIQAKTLSANPGLKEVLGNIDGAREFTKQNDSVKIVAVVSGSHVDQQNFQQALREKSSRLFNGDGSTLVLSLQEKIGNKTREGNFLGTLLAYRYIKEEAHRKGLSYRDFVTMVGMLFGRGERMSPFTNIEGDRKPAIAATSYSSAIEEALMYFGPVAKYLERRGFRGILDKWGDETEIASIDLTAMPEAKDFLADNDVLKVISVIEITEELAKEKDWVVFDENNNMVAQLSRNKKDALIEQLKALGIKPRPDGKYYAGVSLGPVAVSYDVLDIAEEVFAEEIIREGIYFDFDPYLLMALAMQGDVNKWNAAVAADKKLQDLVKMVPGFFEKVNKIRDTFEQRHQRKLSLKILDLGGKVYWADIGQHTAMREKYMAINSEGPTGVIARRIENIPSKRDANGNILVNSTISPGVEVKNSIIINSSITGKGKVESCVVKDSNLHNVQMTGAFAVSSTRSGHLILAKNSGIYKSFGTEDLVLEEGMRHGTLLTDRGPIDVKTHENTDLRKEVEMAEADYNALVKAGDPDVKYVQVKSQADGSKKYIYKLNYDRPIMGNAISFAHAYDIMFGVSMDELKQRQDAVVDKVMAALETMRSREKFPILKFGTSGLRGLVIDMTDMECYINARAFIEYLISIGDIKRGDPVAVGGDRRSSTDRVARAVAKAIDDSGCRVVSCGKVSTPALAYYSLRNNMASIMVTGSHIPDDRNGVKFNKKAGEVLKSDEDGILENVQKVREAVYVTPLDNSLFDDKGMFRPDAYVLSNPAAYEESAVREAYIKRYTNVFPSNILEGKTIVLYQHSAVARDIMKEILEGLGAQVIAVNRSEKFVPVDTENVNAETRALLKKLAEEHKPFAIISSDGDSDRPLFADENGNFLPGDKLGILTLMGLNHLGVKVNFAAVPVTSNDAIVSKLIEMGIDITQTKVGSPHVIKAMNDYLAAHPGSNVVGWEANGGFLLGSNISINGKDFGALPTRDCMLPLISALILAKDVGGASRLISDLPQRYTHADLLKGYPMEISQKVIKIVSPADSKIAQVEFGAQIRVTYVDGRTEALNSASELAASLMKIREDMTARYYTEARGFAPIKLINYIDGVKIIFDNYEVLHLRPSGNAPEFRNYATANTQARAEEMVRVGLREIMPQMREDLSRGITPGVYAVGGVRQKADEAAVAAIIVDVLQENDVNAAVESLFALQENGYLPALREVSNWIRAGYAGLTDAQKNAVRDFVKSVSARALDVADVKIAQGLQIMAGQLVFIASAIEQGIPGATALRVTDDINDMVKAKDRDRGPSYLSARSLRDAGIKIADAEGEMGLYWRGWEGVSKLGDNIAEEAKYDKNKFMAQKDKMVMYVMVHVDGYHTTIFLNAMLPGSIQHVSTGPGHIQLTKTAVPIVDVKQVTRGTGIQYVKVYDENGNLVSVIPQYLKPGAWVVALPGTVDSIENLGGLEFNDFTVPVSEAKAEEVLRSIKPNIGLKNIQGARTLIEKESSVMPYYAVTVNNIPYLVRANAAPAAITAWTIGIYPQAKNLAAYYSSTINNETAIAKLEETLVKTVVPSAWETQEVAVLPVNVNDMPKYVAALAKLNETIQKGLPINVVPARQSIKTGVDGYKWGQPLLQSKILESMGAVTEAQKIALAKQLGLVRPEATPEEIVANKEVVAEHWFATGMIDMGTGYLLPMETLSLFENQFFGQPHLAAFGPNIVITAKQLGSAVPLSVQSHDFDEMIIAQEAGYAYLGLRQGLTSVDMFKALVTGKIEALMNRVKLEKGDMYTVPAGMIHAYGTVNVLEIKKVTPEQDRAGTRSFYDRLKMDDTLKQTLLARLAEAENTVNPSMSEQEFITLQELALRQLPSETVRKGKDALTMELAKLMDNIRSVEKAGYLKTVNPETLKVNPIRVTSTKDNRSKVELLSTNPGFTWERFTVETNEVLPAEYLINISPQRIFVERGTIEMTKETGETVVLEPGVHLMPASEVRYLIRAVKGPATVYIDYSPSLRGEAIITTAYQAMQNEIDRQKKMGVIEKRKFKIWVPKKLYGNQKILDIEKSLISHITGGDVQIQDYTNLSNVAPAPNDVVVVVDQELESAKSAEKVADILKSIRMLTIPKSHISPDKTIFFARELEATGFLLGNTDNKDIEDKTARALDLANIMRQMTGREISMADIGALISAAATSDSIDERFKKLIDHLLLTMPIKLGDALDKGLESRRAVLWSV